MLKGLFVVSMEAAIYWLLLALSVLPYIYGYTLSLRKPETYLRRFASVFFYATAVSWALILMPVNTYEVGWVCINVQQVIMTNAALLFTAELLIDPSPSYEPSVRVLCSINSWVILLVIILYICSVVLQTFRGGSSSADTETEGGSLSDQPVWLGTKAVDFIGTDFLAELTLFVTITEIIISFVTAAIRRVMTAKHLSARYDSGQFYLALGLLTIAAATIKLLPGAWGVVFHRTCTWSALYVCLSARKAESKVYYAPLRSSPEHPQLSLSTQISEDTTDADDDGNDDITSLCVV